VRQRRAEACGFVHVSVLIEAELDRLRRTA
jgi:hypothetical protein